MNKQKEITLRKNDERERSTGKTKPQNITESNEKEICMGCNKYVKTGVQCGSCYRWYHYKCEGRKSRNCIQRKHTTYVKRTKTQS